MHRASLGEIQRYVEREPAAPVVTGHDPDTWPAVQALYGRWPPQPIRVATEFSLQDATLPRPPARNCGHRRRRARGRVRASRRRGERQPLRHSRRREHARRRRADRHPAAGRAPSRSPPTARARSSRPAGASWPSTSDPQARSTGGVNSQARSCPSRCRRTARACSPRGAARSCVIDTARRSPHRACPPGGTAGRIAVSADGTRAAVALGRSASGSSIIQSSLTRVMRRIGRIKLRRRSTGVAFPADGRASRGLRPRRGAARAHRHA